jgi:hypothetical protein
VADPSWRLKIARAEHHFRELKWLVQQYQAGHHYRAVCPDPPKEDPTHWRFVLEIGEQPSPQITVVLGDCLFNIRSALDHVAVACAPSARKREAGFPVVTDPGDAKQMEKFESQIRGMDAGAIVNIDSEQPYRLARRSPKAGPQSLDALSVLSALQNADKHRSLAVLVPGLSDPTVRASWSNEAISIMSPAYIEAGEQVLWWDELGNRIRYEDLRVDVRGRSRVAVVVSGRPDPFDVVNSAGGILGRVSMRIIPNLEPYVRS